MADWVAAAPGNIEGNHISLGDTLKRLVLTAAAVLIALTGCVQEPPPPSVPDIQARADAFNQKLASEKASDERAFLERTTAPLIAADGQAAKVLLLGDSLARGANATSSDKQFASVVKAGIISNIQADISSIAQGSSGGGLRVADITPQIDPEAAFDLIIIELGTNDAVTPKLDAFSADYDHLLAAVRNASSTASLICLGAWGSPKDTSAFDDLIKAKCAAEQGQFRETSSIFKDEKMRWANGIMPDGTKVDNFHPNDAGHAAIAKQILSAIRFS